MSLVIILGRKVMKLLMIKKITMNKYIHILAVLSCVLSSPVAAQDYTAHHDAMKMNQFTVMEQGVGGLTPAFYYQWFHNNYQKTAAEQNKTLYRSMTDALLYEQKAYAEDLDSALIARASVEALNMADRELDIVWATEGGKITTMLERFRTNINYVMFLGGTYDAYKRWVALYDMFSCGIQYIRDAYMPNAERKVQFLRLYEDIEAQNEILLSVLTYYSYRSSTKDLLTASGTIEKVSSSGKERLATVAFGRWKVAWGTHIHNGEGLLTDDSSSASSDDDGVIVTPAH